MNVKEWKQKYHLEMYKTYPSMAYDQGKYFERIDRNMSIYIYSTNLHRHTVMHCFKQNCTLTNLKKKKKNQTAFRTSPKNRNRKKEDKIKKEKN